MGLGPPSTVVHRPFLLQSAHTLLSDCLTSSRSVLACFSDVALSCRTDILRRHYGGWGLRTIWSHPRLLDPFRFHVDWKTRART